VKKSVLGLAGVCVLMATMSCQVPQSITIKGKPGVYIPLGSPFTKLDEDKRLESYVSPEKIKEMMGSGTNDKVYDYTVLNDTYYTTVHTYATHYAIAEITVDTNGMPVNPPPGNLTTNLPDRFHLLKGSYPFKNDLKNFLGEGATFKKALGYIYVGGIGTKSTLSLTYTNLENPINKSLIPDNSLLKSLTSDKRPVFPELDSNPYVGPIKSHSLDNPSEIDLIDILNAQSPSTLHYEIKIPFDEIDKIDRKIIVDMVILLPLEFDVTAPSGDPAYAKLNLKDVFPENTGNGDLFGRTNNDGDDLISNLDTLKIILKRTTNNIIAGDLYIMVVTGGTGGKIKKYKPLDFHAGKYIEFTNDDLGYPFSPQFEIVLKKDPSGKGSFKIQPQSRDSHDPAAFDFFLTVEAQAHIDQTIEL